jgi:hypothetical protein
MVEVVIMTVTVVILMMMAVVVRGVIVLVKPKVSCYGLFSWLVLL